MFKPALLTLLLFPAFALAQSADAPRGKAHAWKTDAQGHAMMNRQDVEIAMPRLAPHFDEIDANKDGYLARDEIRTWHQATHKGMDHGMHQDMQHKAAERFKDADKNGDGKLSREEAKAMPHVEQNFDAIDADKDGQITRDELRAYGKAKAAERKERMGKAKEEAAAHFKQADKNNDGKLSREEAKAMPHVEKNFDAIDADKDGQVTPDEIRNFMREKMKQRRGDKGEAAPAAQ